MAYRKYKLGDLVEQYDEINQNGEFTKIEDLQGINSNKYFQECKSNKNDIDLLRYRICRHGMFSYNRATSRNGEKISIALRTGDDCIVSPSYYCFRVKNEDVLCPEYLDIWFKRPAFDKYARFNSWGSATEFFTFDDFCATEIMLPPLPEQRKIVHDYQVITDRIELLRKMNENLEEQNLILYKAYFEGFEMSGGEMPPDWNRMTVGDVATVTRGASPRPIQDFMCENGMPWVKISDASASFSKYLFETAECIIEDGISKSRLVKPKTLIVSNSASPGLPMLMEIEACVHDGWLIIDHFKGVSQEFMYYFFINERQKIVLQSNGSVFNNLKTDIVKEQPIVIPDEKTMAKVTKHFQTINNVILNNAKEAEVLKRVRNYLLRTIMTTNAKGA